MDELTMNNNRIALTDEDFVTIGIRETEADKIIRPSISFWSDVWRRLKKNKAAMAGLLFVLLVSLGTVILPMLSPTPTPPPTLPPSTRGSAVSTGSAPTAWAVTCGPVSGSGAGSRCSSALEAR